MLQQLAVMVFLTMWLLGVASLAVAFLLGDSSPAVAPPRQTTPHSTPLPANHVSPSSTQAGTIAPGTAAPRLPSTSSPTPSPTATPQPTAALMPTGTPTPTVTASPPPDSVYLNVIGHRQSHSLSCESRSAADLAAHWSVVVEEDTFLASLPRSDNPHAGFVGDVDGPPGNLPPDGYGVYAEPVAEALRGLGLAAQTRYWLGVEGLQTELAAGRPVMIWATHGLQVQATSEYLSTDGRLSTVVPYEHTFLAIGYDAGGFYLLDPYDGYSRYYSNASLLEAWGLLDQMAVTVSGVGE